MSPAKQKSLFFFNKEFKQISGAGNQNLIIISVLLFISFSAIGLLNSSIINSSKKLNDKYVNRIAEEKILDPDELNALNAFINDSVKLDSFKIDTIFFDYSIQLAFTSGINFYRGNSIELEDPIMERIFSEDNCLVGKQPNDPSLFGLIIDEKLMKECGLSLEDFPFYLETYVSNRDGSNRFLGNFPVIAVVKEMPYSKSNFIISPFLVQSILYPNDVRKISPSTFRTDSRTIQVVCEKNDSLNVKIDKFIRYLNTATGYKFNRDLKPKYTDLYNDYATFFIYEQMGLEVDRSILEKYFNESNDFVKIVSFFSVGDHIKLKRSDYDDDIQKIARDLIVISFNSAKSINETEEYFKTHFGIYFNKGKVKTLGHLFFTVNFSKAVSYLIILIISLLTGFFLMKTVNNHIDKRRKHLGLMLATGYSNLFLLKIYVSVVLVLIFISSLAAVLSCILFDSFQVYSQYIKMFNLQSHENLTGLVINYFPTYIALGLIYLFTLIVCLISIKKRLSKTPGDLIYERD
jgi:hypothetical protein